MVFRSVHKGVSLRTWFHVIGNASCLDNKHIYMYFRAEIWFTSVEKARKCNETSYPYPMHMDATENLNSVNVQLFSKLCCLIYAMSMLVIILRIQLSIIGGYLYKDSGSIPVDIQEKYLSLTQNLMNEGLDKISSKISVVCTNVLEQMDLKKPMRSCDLDALLWSLQTAIERVEDNPIDNMKTYIAMNLEEITSSKNIYTSLLRDTLDLLESDDVKSLTTQCINRGFIQFANQVSKFFVQKSAKNPSWLKEDSEELDMEKPLAKLLPIIHGMLSKKSFPEKCMHELVTNEKLLLFSANIYESLL